MADLALTPARRRRLEQPVTAGRYPGAARSLAEHAIKAGWTVGAGPDPEDAAAYNLTLGPPDPTLLYRVRWRLRDGRWSMRHAERKHTPPGGPFRTDEVRLADIGEAIKATPS